MTTEIVSLVVLWLRMNMEIISLVVFWINALPLSPSIVGELSPRQIVPGMTVDYVKHFRIQFREYSQVQEAHDNTIHARATGAIALLPTGNTKGAYYFMSLSTRRRLNLQHFTPLPLPQDIIDGVHLV